MSIMFDMEQNEKISKMGKEIAMLNDEITNTPSAILRNLVGKECVIDTETNNYECTVLDVDAKWMSLSVHVKKSDDVNVIIPIYSIEEITVNQ